MRNYKRLLVMLMAALMCALLMCGCGKGEIKGTRVDCGSYSVIVPEGWTNSNSGDGTIAMYPSADNMDKYILFVSDSDVELSYDDIKGLAASSGEPVDDIILDGVKCAGYQFSSEEVYVCMYVGEIKNGKKTTVMVMNMTASEELLPGVISSFKWK